MLRPQPRTRCRAPTRHRAFVPPTSHTRARSHTETPTLWCADGGILGRLWVQVSRPALPCRRCWPDTAGIAAVLVLLPTSPGPVALAPCSLARSVPGPPSCPVERGHVPCVLSEPTRVFCPVGSWQRGAAELEAGADRRHNDRNCQVTVTASQCRVTRGTLPSLQHQRDPGGARGSRGMGANPGDLPCPIAMCQSIHKGQEEPDPPSAAC